MNNKVIYDIAKDYSWIVINPPNNYEKLFIRPDQILLVNKWLTDDPVEVIVNKGDLPYDIQVTNNRTQEVLYFERR